MPPPLRQMSATLPTTTAARAPWLHDAPCPPQVLLTQDAGYAMARMAQTRRIFMDRFLGAASVEPTRRQGQPSFFASFNPEGIAVDQTAVYWADNRPAFGAVQKPVRRRCHPCVVGRNTPLNVAVDDHNAYWTDINSRTVRMAPKDGVDAGFIQLWQSNAPSRRHCDRRVARVLHRPRWKAVPDDGGWRLARNVRSTWRCSVGFARHTRRHAAYWTVRTQTTGSVNVINKTGATAGTLAASQAQPVDVASDGISLYWLNRGTGLDGALLTCNIAAARAPQSLRAT